MNVVASSLCAALFRASIQGGMALIAVWLICRCAPRLPAAVRSVLWRLALLRLLFALFFPAALTIPLLPAAPVPVAANAPLSAEGAETTPPAVTDAPHLEQAASPIRENAISGSSSALRLPEAKEAFVLLYLIGVAFFAVRWMRGFVRAGRLYRASVPAEKDSPLSGVYRAIAAALNVRAIPELRLSAAAPGPMLLGGRFHAAVLLPVALTHDLTDDEMRLLLAHELAHAKRRDLLFEKIGGVAQALFFFHPLLYVARAEEKAAREMACDQMALAATQENPVAYGRLLVRVALPKAASSPLLSGAMGVAEQGNLLLRRLRALAAPRPPRRYLVAVIALIAPPLAATLIPWRPVPAAAQGDKKMETPTRKEAPSKTVARGATMQGRVLSPDGEPVAGAKVYALAHLDADPILGSSVTDAQGKYRLLCRTDPAAAQWNRPDAETLIASDSKGNLTITKVEKFQAQYPLRLIRPGNHTAIFRDAQGKPIPNLAVYAKTFHHNAIAIPLDTLKRMGLPTGEGKTDAQGRIITQGFPTTEYVGLRASDPRYVIYRTTFDQVNGENRLYYTMFLSAAISGKVTPLPGMSKAGIPVEAAGNARLGDFMAGGEAQTDANGNYRLRGLLPGKYTLQFGRLRSDYARQTKSNILTKAGSETANVNVTLTPGALIQGKAHSENGDPLPDVTVAAFAGDSQDAVTEYRKTDAQGQYQMRVPPGRIELKIIGIFPPFPPQPPTDRVLNVREGQTQTEDFAIAGGKREKVSGILLDSEGKPISYAEVTPVAPTADQEGDFWLSVQQTSAKGHFQVLGQLRSGAKIKLIVRKGDFSGEVTTTTGEDQTLRIAMKYLPLATVKGRVMDANGRPVAATIEALQQISDKYSSGSGRIKADRQGRFVFSALPEFAYRLTVFKEGEGRVFYPAPQKSLNFPAGKVTDLGDIKLPAAQGVLTGRIQDEQGNPITGAQVWLRGYHTWAIAPASANGVFQAKNILENETLTATVLYKGHSWRFLGLKAGRLSVALTLKESAKTRLPTP